MIAGDVINVADVPIEVISEIGKIGNWLEALGIIVILWIIFQAISLWTNRKRMKEIYLIKEDMKRIESKIDKILNSKKR
jgi:FtsZ-interacting cell division protein ZipA